jgi:hypothetical protein
MLAKKYFPRYVQYCVNVYGFANATTLKSLKLKQKEAVRIISNSGYRNHRNPIFKRLSILPLEQLITFSNLKFMQFYVHGRLPVAFNEIWTSKPDRNPNLNLRNEDSLYSVCQLTNTLTWPCTVYVVASNCPCHCL